MIIAIDGPAASGKSTSAKLLAKELGYLYLDTGAMYRCIAFSVLENKIDISSNHKIILGDISNKDAIKQTLKDADAIIYTIGIIREFKRKNITFDYLHHQGIKNVIEEAEKLKINEVKVANKTLIIFFISPPY